MKTHKYRIVATPTNDIKFPVKYTAQRKRLFGWANIEWSYSDKTTQEYINSYHRTITKITPHQFPPTVIKEFEL